MAEDRKAEPWTSLARLTEGVPPFAKAAALVLCLSLAVLGVVASKAVNAPVVAVLTAAAMAIGLMVHLLTHRGGVMEMAENLDGRNAQTAFAELLSRAYDPRAKTIYAVTSGYTEESVRDAAARKRMHRVMDSLDRCLAKGVTVIRLHVEPFGQLSPDYVDRVARQLRGETESGEPLLGEAKIYDMRDLPTLPSMAVIQDSRGNGVIFHVLERLHREGARAERRAELVWKVLYEEKHVTPLLRSLGRITEGREAITTEQAYRVRIAGNPPDMAQPKVAATHREADRG